MLCWQLQALVVHQRTRPRVLPHTRLMWHIPVTKRLNDARLAEMLGCREMKTRRSGPPVDEDYEGSESQGPSGCECYVAHPRAQLGSLIEKNQCYHLSCPPPVAASPVAGWALREPPVELAEGSGCFGSARQLAKTGDRRG